MYLWMAITKDRFELPIAVATSAGELARMLGKQKNTIESVVSKTEHGVGAKRPPYVRIWIDETEDKKDDGQS